MPISSGITRFSIRPSDSRVSSAGPPRPRRSDLPSLRDLHALPAPEGVVVGDDDLRAVQVGQQVVRDQLPAPVVAVRVVRLQHPQPVPDGEAGGDDQEPAGEPPALPPPHRVDGLPGDQHGHHHGLAGARGELEREAQQPRIRLPTGVFQVLEEGPAGPLRPVGGDLGQPDDGLDRLDLTEEGPKIPEPVMPPVPEQARGLRGHPPSARVRPPAPGVDLAAHPVDDLGVAFVLLLPGREILALVEDQPFLLGSASALPRLGDGGDELGPAAALDDLLGGLAVAVQLPVPARVRVRGVEDGVLEESIVHSGYRPPTARSAPREQRRECIPSARGSAGVVTPPWTTPPQSRASAHQLRRGAVIGLRQRTPEGRLRHVLLRRRPRISRIDVFLRPLRPCPTFGGIGGKVRLFHRESRWVRMPQPAGSSNRSCR